MRIPARAFSSPWILLAGWGLWLWGAPYFGEELKEAALSGAGEGGQPTRIDILARTALLEDEEHASLLIPRIEALLEELGATVGDLAGLVVGAGPGSFTGLRVGAATAKGMVRALGIPLWAFSSLAGAAASVDGDPLRPRCVLFDARGDRVYAASYRIRRRCTGDPATADSGNDFRNHG